MVHTQGDPEITALLLRQNALEVLCECSPANLALTVAFSGLRAPRTELPFVFCELFAGRGATSLLHAAAMPHASFYTLDAAASNVALGRGMATDAGLKNIEFLEGCPDSLQLTELPPCDFLCIHDAHLLELTGAGGFAQRIARTLSPGGVCCLDYQCAPGLREKISLIRLIRGHVAQTGGDLEQRLHEAIAAVRRIVEAEESLARHLSCDMGWLDSLGEHLTPELAFALLHPSWEPLDPGEVISVLSAAGLRYAGQALQHYNHANLCMEEKALEAYARFDATPVGESIKALYARQEYRYDVFVRGAPAMSALEKQAALERLSFVTLVPPADFRSEMDTPHGRLRIEEELAGPVVGVLAKGIAEYGALLDALGGRSSENIEALHQVLAMLLDSRQLGLVSQSEPSPESMGSMARMNAALLRQFRYEPSCTYAVSALLGGGLPMGWENQAMRLAYDEARGDRRLGVKYFLQQLDNVGHPLLAQTDGGQSALDAAMQLVASMWQVFEESFLPTLAKLRVV